MKRKRRPFFKTGGKMKKVIVFTCILLFTGICLSQTIEEKTIVKIGKQGFTVREFKENIDKMRTNFANLTPEMKKRILDQFVKEKLFTVAAIDEKTKLTDEQTKKLENLKQMYLISNYINKILQENPVTETEMKKTYDANPGKYQSPEKRKLRHIIVSDQEKAKQLLEQLKNGADFAQLASQNNIDATKQRGGDLNWAQKGIFVKEFEDVAFSLKKGEISDIVKTQFGYHIIKVEDIMPPQQRSYQEVAQEIKRELEKQRISQIEENLRKKYKVEVDYTILDKI